jgi:hypothetical protein
MAKAQKKRCCAAAKAGIHLPSAFYETLRHQEAERLVLEGANACGIAA